MNLNMKMQISMRRMKRMEDGEDLKGLDDDFELPVSVNVSNSRGSGATYAVSIVGALVGEGNVVEKFARAGKDHEISTVQHARSAPGGEEDLGLTVAVEVGHGDFSGAHPRLTVLREAMRGEWNDSDIC